MESRFKDPVIRFPARRSKLRRVLFILLLGLSGIEARCQLFDLECVVGDLCSEAHGGRLAGTDGERTAAEYLVRQLKRLGGRPAFKGEWFQSVRLQEPLSGKGQNVAGLLPGSAGSEQPIILLTAHYDHLGDGRLLRSSAGLGEIGQVHPGADDNASGVAVCLRTAERLLSREERSFGVLVMFFTAEEADSQGVRHFAQSSPPGLDRVVLAINFDQVGRLEHELFYELSTVAERDRLELRLQEVGNAIGLALKPLPRLSERTDASVLAAAGITTLSLHTGGHEDIHRPTDTPDKLNYAGMERIAAFAASMAKRFPDPGDRP